jgi:hypothetical protein
MAISSHTRLATLQRYVTPSQAAFAAPMAASAERQDSAGKRGQDSGEAADEADAADAVHDDLLLR